MARNIQSKLVNSDTEVKQKPVFFADSNLYGYTHAIVYNETVKNNQEPIVNTDVSVLTKNLHSKEAVQMAAQSLGSDIE